MSKSQVFKALDTFGEAGIAGLLVYGFRYITGGGGTINIAGLNVGTNLVAASLTAGSVGVTSVIDNYAIPLINKKYESGNDSDYIRSIAPAVTIGSSMLVFGSIDYMNGYGLINMENFKGSLLAGASHMAARYINDAALGSLARLPIISQ